MKLDEYELDYVKYFIQVKGYHQYEVQAEIMDHFVLLLEDKKLDDSTAQFEDLVNDTYETVGKNMFREINYSTKRKVTEKYNRLFLGHLVTFLHYKHALLIIIAGILLYYFQSFLQNTANFLVAPTLTSIALYYFIYKFSSATELGNPKFMSNKITKRYGSYLLLAAFIIFGTLIKVVLKPSSLGFSTYYLISTVALILLVIIAYSLARTARIIVKESIDMEETYQILK